MFRFLRILFHSSSGSSSDRRARGTRATPPSSARGRRHPPRTFSAGISPVATSCSRATRRRPRPSPRATSPRGRRQRGNKVQPLCDLQRYVKRVCEVLLTVIRESSFKKVCIPSEAGKSFFFRCSAWVLCKQPWRMVGLLSIGCGARR